MFLLSFAENSIQLVPDGTLFLHIAIILLMVFVLNNLLFKPVNSTLDRRAINTKGRSDEAQSTLRSVEESISNYERSLRDARVEGYALMEQQRAEAVRDRQSALDKVREEVNGSIEKEKLNIQAANRAGARYA
jgi:F-type H+-transporting ATPase subunit b